MIDHRTAAGRWQLLRSMISARAFDQAMSRHNKHWHEARGEEGTYIGAYAGLGDVDIAAPHFRGACGVAMLHGSDVYDLAAAVFGTGDSPTGGHWRGDICPAPTSRRVGMYSGSLGTTVSYAVGGALHLQQAGIEAVVVCAYGDGTANTGIVAESMNMAAMLSLPIVFICQDNQYATSLPSSIAISGSLTGRAGGLGLPAQEVDGNDVLAVADLVTGAAAASKAGEGPQFIHARTYRMGGHYMNDPETYRSEDEVARWAAKDPILRLVPNVIEDGLVARAEVDAFTAAEERRIEDAVVAAREGGSPPAEAFTCDHAFAETWRRVS